MLKHENETKDESNNPLTKRARMAATYNGHTLRRAATLGVDQVLSLDDDGDLEVATAEFYVLKSAGDYHCSCDETFDGPEEAAAHLHKAKMGVLGNPEAELE